MINDFSQFCSQSGVEQKRVFLRVDIYFLNGGVPYILVLLVLILVQRLRS